MNFNNLMALLMAISGIINIVLGNDIAGAGFWIAAAIFHLTSELPKRAIKSRK